jgi:hypothetical protein
MHADRTNRAMLVLFAVLLLAVGMIGALTSFGAFGGLVEHAHLFANPVGIYIGHHGVWLWPVIAAAGLLMAVLALRWLAVLLFSTDRTDHIRLPGDHSTGRTTLLGAALIDAITEEIRAYPGVHSAKARLIGDTTSPDLVIETTLEQSADLSALRQRIETNAVAHARQALDNPNLPVTLDLTVNDRHARTIS